LEARSKNQALDLEQSSLAKAKSDVIKYSDLGKIAKSVVPQDKDQAQTVREIVKIASAAGVKLGAVNFPTSNLGQKVAPVPAASGSTATPAASPSSSSALALSQLKPVVGITGVYDLAITVQSDASSPAEYSKFIDFLAGLENNRRTALVGGITITPDTKSPDHVSFTLNIDEYIKP
jgi:hypothetical protein